MLALKDVTKTYGGEAGYPALAGISFAIQSGEFCALVGPSGSGKSTLMNLIGLLDRPTGGSINLRGQELGSLSRAEAARIRNREIGFVFQAFHLLPRLSAWENVALPLLSRGAAECVRRDRALAALDLVQLADLSERKPSELSGGQRQRVAIARALVGEPQFLLADEPTGSLDSKTAAHILDLFAALNSELQLTTIIVTHDLALAARCGRRIELLDGLVVADTATPT
jgi:putative ABC transport system ATP-binding protein